MPPQDSWSEWQKHILAELERLSKQNESVLKALSEQQTKMAAMEVRAGLWGAMAGMVPTVIMLVMCVLTRK